MFFGNPAIVEQAELLIRYGAPVLKVGSDDLVHLPLLRDLASLGLPMILSTGMGERDEIAEALDAVQAAPGVALLHCVSLYPTPLEKARLDRIKTLADEFQLLVTARSGRDVLARDGYPVIGYSDHTDGSEPAAIAVALGACIVEKHFTLDRPSPIGWDRAPAGVWRSS